MSYANFGLDLTWDMFNSIGGINDKRVFSIIPYLGVGTSYAWDYNNGGNILDNDGNPMDHQWVVNGTFGMEFRFRTSKRVDLYIDARMTATADNINNVAWKTGVDPIFSLTGGLKINLGKEGRHATKYDPYDCSGEIKALNDRINAMRDELNQKDARLRAAESQLPCPEVKEQPVVEQKAAAEWQPAVRFRINSATVSANDKVTLYDVAKYMNENQDVKAIIKGYADKDTGTEEYNSNLEKVWSYTGYIESLINYSMDTDTDGDDFTFSQYLFNNDDEFEFFLQKERPASNPEYEGQTETYGFQLMQSNGNAIIDLDFDQPLNDGSSINFYTYQLGNGKLILELNYYHNGDHYIRYMYDPAQAGAVQLISKGQMKAYPNPVKAGDMFRISGVKGITGATVTVNRMDGSLVNAFICDATVAEIPTGGMSDGMYLYTVTRNGKVLASGKIVVE